MDEEEPFSRYRDNAVGGEGGDVDVDVEVWIGLGLVIF
jgi:hypothetical protein